MPMTPNSGDPYLTPAEFLLYYDARLVGDLIRDDGTQATALELATDASLAAVLAAASGEVEAACVAGGRYAPADLAACTGNSRALLKKLVADLAILSCRDRRGAGDKDLPLSQAEQSRKTLAALHAGSMVFGFVEVVAASVTQDRYFTQDDLNRQNLITGWMGSRSLGTRMNRYERPR